ncbi:MAG: phosphoribosylanthranilate isomerase [Verrucomicrobia bacterium]|nr:phosphoribosylanthranilate isomerase [Verrucomicrobiota bacterium]
MHPRVKICGITNLGDAMAAVRAGADALGFVFYPASPRNVVEDIAATIIGELPPFVAKVGVFVNVSAEKIRHTVETCGLDTLQLHGDESTEFCRQFRMKVIKAFRVRDEQSLKEMAAYQSEAWLLDACVPGKLGGTGERFNWELAKQATTLSATVILAGGLTPENVAEAVRQVAPYGVDVSSGVELSPGKKDPIKLRDFIAAAKGSAR